MKYPRYPKYKDSGVEWLGEVPKGWAFIPLWAIFRRTKQTGFETEELLSVYRDYGVIPKSSRGDNFNNPSEDLSPYQLVSTGDLVINKMKAWQGSVAISNYSGIVSPAYFVYSAIHAENPHYLHYLFRADQYITAYFSISKGIRINQWDLDPQYHSRIPVLLPTHDEQQTIATFLDHNCAKIDALIAEQEKLITLLREKRQAVISHAVTKGLHPDAPTKDSGVEWLGEVPEGWELWKLAHAFEVIGSGTTPKSDNGLYYDGSIPWVTTSELREGKIIDTNSHITPFALDSHPTLKIYPQGTLLVAMYGATIGRMGILATEATCNQACCALTKEVSLTTHFMFYWFQGMKSILLSFASGGGQPNLSQEIIRSITVATPPKPEQQAIIAYLDAETAKIDALITESEKAVTLLKERRSALISAAVTDKIDVCNIPLEN